MRIITAFLFFAFAVPTSVADPLPLTEMLNEEVRQCQKAVMDVINADPEFSVQMARHTLMTEYTHSVIKITCRSEVGRRLEEWARLYQEEIRRMEKDVEDSRKKRSQGKTM